MPIDPNGETEVRNQVEQEFAHMENVAAKAGPGIIEMLQVYGGLEAALRQADEYLSLLNPTSTTFSTTSTSNIER